MYPLFIGFGIAYLLMSYLDFSMDSSLKIHKEGRGGSGSKSLYFVDKASILSRNILDLDKGEPLVASSIKKNSSNSATTVSDNFAGALIGILKGEVTSYAIFKINDDIILIKEGTEKQGIFLKEVHKLKVEIEYNGKIYFPEFEDQINTAVGKSLPVNKPSAHIKEIVISDNKVSIARSVLVNELKDINKVLKSVFVSPYYKSGDFVGYRLSRLRRTSIFKKIGLKNGDIIVNINGEELTTPEKLFELFGRAEELTALTIDMLRRGKKESLFVEIN